MPELDVVMMGTQLRKRGATPKKTRNTFLRGLQSLKEDAEDCGVNLSI